MPFKFFQEIQIGQSTFSPLEKIKAGDQVLAAVAGKEKLGWQLKQVQRESSIFPRNSWNGIRVIVKGVKIYGSPELPFLLTSGKVVHMSELNVGDALQGADGKSQEIEEVASGKVLCGIKSFYIEPEGNPHWLNLQGLVVGDQRMEDALKAGEDQRSYQKELFPENPVLRAIRKVLMKFNGQKKPLVNSMPEE